VKNAPLPHPDDDLIAPSRSLLKWDDLREPTEAELTAAMKRLLVTAVAGDTRATRRDEQLNQICNVVLVKLESDAAGEAAPGEPVPFQIIGSERERVERTAERVHEQFRELYNRRRTDIFTNDDSADIKLDDQTIYEAVVELSGYRMLYVPVEVVAKAFQIFRTKALKSEEGQYFTPQRIIKSAVVAMDLDYSDKIIDPACGTGGFLLEAIHAIKERHAPDDARKHLLIKWANEKAFGVDLDAINVKLTRAMMLSIGDGSTHTLMGDSLRSHRWHEHYPDLIGPLADGQYTAVITNPPFGKDLKFKAADARAAGFSIANAAAMKGPHDFAGLEIGLIFLERAHKLLRVGGRVGIVLPETYFFSHRYRWLHDWLEGRLELRGVLHIPMEAFQEFCRAKTNFYIFEKVGEGRPEEE